MRTESTRHCKKLASLSLIFLSLLTSTIVHADVQDYEAERQNFHLSVPAYFNFARDVVDKWAEDASKIAFLDQEIELLPMDQTPLQYFESRFCIDEETLRRELHKAALGGADLLRRPFFTLSTGQRKRMMLLSIVLEKPNVLLLDEPTNHLDFITLEAFEKAILEFDGAVVAVSHDATFIEKIATQKWMLGKG